jgi:hypothetical protein
MKTNSKVLGWAALAAIGGMSMGMQLGIMCPAEHPARPVVFLAPLACICWMLAMLWIGLVGRDSTLVSLMTFLLAMFGLVMGAGATWMSDMRGVYSNGTAAALMLLTAFATSGMAAETLLHAEMAWPRRRN